VDSARRVRRCARRGTGTIVTDAEAAKRHGEFTLRVFDIMRAQIEASPPPGAGDHGAGMAAFDAAIATAREAGALPASASAAPGTSAQASFALTGPTDPRVAEAIAAWIARLS